jgi:hypothetical protein
MVRGRKKEDSEDDAFSNPDGLRSLKTRDSYHRITALYGRILTVTYGTHRTAHRTVGKNLK